MSVARKVVSYCLFPLTMWYAVGIVVRNIMFGLGIKKQVAPHVTTIGVGNIACGGTGKTPHVEYLLRLLSNQYKTAYLSRGYRRKTIGFVQSEGVPDAKRIGDEAAMIALKYPNITTCVCERRVEGINKLLAQEEPPQLVLLDDVYQHQYVKPTINILLTEFQRPFYHDHILPYGNLREFHSARNRANIIIITKCPEKLPPIEKNNILYELKALPCQKVFFSYLRYGSPQRLSDNNHTVDLKNVDHVIVLSGIAHPDTMVNYVKQTCEVTLMQYSDHHNYTMEEVKLVADTFSQLHGERKIILTTEKDAVRLQGADLETVLNDLPIYVLPIEVCFHDTQEFSFDKTILSSVKENIIFLDRLKTSHLAQL